MEDGFKEKTKYKLKSDWKEILDEHLKTANFPACREKDVLDYIEFREIDDLSTLTFSGAFDEDGDLMLEYKYLFLPGTCIEEIITI